MVFGRERALSCIYSTRPVVRRCRGCFRLCASKSCPCFGAPVNPCFPFSHRVSHLCATTTRALSQKKRQTAFWQEQGQARKEREQKAKVGLPESHAFAAQTGVIGRYVILTEIFKLPLSPPPLGAVLNTGRGEVEEATGGDRGGRSTKRRKNGPAGRSVRLSNVHKSSPAFGWRSSPRLVPPLPLLVRVRIICGSL